MAEITLSNTNVAAYTEKQGTTSFTLATGQSLKMETSPDGYEILDIEVPEGKSWEVYIKVKVVETEV